MNQTNPVKAIITRQEAIAQGRTRYYTGKPCKHGHLAERHIGGSCSECQRIYQKAYSQTEQRKESNRKKQQRQQQTEKCRARDLQRQKKRNAEHPHYVIAHVIRAKYPAAIIPLTEAEQTRVATIYRIANALRQRTGQKWEVDHCYPLVRGGVHHPDNLMILPATLNRQKRDKADPANPAVFHGALVSFSRMMQGQKQEQGRTPLLIARV